jgi:hypothetical protein
MFKLNDQTWYKINGEGRYSWNQLLYWCESKIKDKRYNKYGWSINRYWAEKEFFSDFRHNDNDGTRTRAQLRQNHHYERIQQKDPVTNCLTGIYIKTLIFDDWYWIPSAFTPKTFQVTDNLGRIIPSTWIKEALVKYVPSNKDKISKAFYTSWRHNKYFTFRRGPVPYTACHKNSNWRRIGNNHAGRSAMKRQWFRDDIYRKEILEEFGVTFKMDRKEITHRHNHWPGKSWKRTKGIHKQFERKLKYVRV